MRASGGRLIESRLTRDRTGALADLAGEELTEAERAVVDEEEALLAAVRGALAARRAALRADENLVGRLRELRDEALESTDEGPAHASSRRWGWCGR